MSVMDAKEKIRFKWKSKAKVVRVFMMEYCFRTELIPFCSFSQTLNFFSILLK